MTLEWFGHACFKLSGSGGSVVFDPYADGSVPGLILPPLTASAVICSHGHSDHSAADAVRCVGNGFPFPVRVGCQIDCVGRFCFLLQAIISSASLAATG